MVRPLTSSSVWGDFAWAKVSEAIVENGAGETSPTQFSGSDHFCDARSAPPLRANSAARAAGAIDPHAPTASRAQIPMLGMARERVKPAADPHVATSSRGSFVYQRQVQEWPRRRVAGGTTLPAGRETTARWRRRRRGEGRPV